MDSRVSATGLDHIVLLCTDVDRTLGWYVDELGLEPLRVEEWREGDVSFPSARIDEGTIIDFFPGEAETGRLDHLCVVVDPVDLHAVAASGRLDVVSGPAPRWGARGMGTSLYVRDPDGTIVEIRHY